MRFVSVFVLLMMAGYPYVVSSIYDYAFPNDTYIGSKSSLPLIIISLLLIVSAIVCLILPFKECNVTVLRHFKWISKLNQQGLLSYRS